MPTAREDSFKPFQDGDSFFYMCRRFFFIVQNVRFCIRTQQVVYFQFDSLCHRGNPLDGQESSSLYVGGQSIDWEVSERGHTFSHEAVTLGYS